ncbi:sensor histidine kinase [Trichlorobacter ammonificans]|uniref:histidine kinase n=1 Tax=Trichlorobacter ammonificans TaxID=2916410 RepID=A0ABM9D5E8_9BACT|nr:ATP-binding protein [Trichlorobacter ammonificans]CAH2030464.1 Histidine kinase [Trichlorobacter ammonificans]
MRCNLQMKLMALLLAVIVIALSSAVLVRGLVIRDFRAFGEGRMLDRLYQVQAVLEGRYRQQMAWRPAEVADDLVWAWLMGFDIRLLDARGTLVLDSSRALAHLPPSMRERVLAAAGQRLPLQRQEEFQPFPLFMGGEEVGTLEVRLPTPPREDFFIASSNKFLTYSVLGLGCIALVLSILAARRLARPVRELTAAAEEIAAGDAARRVRVTGNDEISRLAVSFNRMADALERQERVRKQLVSNAAHELRTPLMVIRGELEGMMDGLLPTTTEALQSLHDETTRLTGILDGVDELTRAQTASLTLQRREVALVPFLRDLLSRFSRRAEAENVILDVAGDTGLTAWIDPDQFTRIIINLVSNALRALPEGGLLSLLASRTVAGSVQLDITDTGCGIEADLLPHIFERFAKGKGGGLGLGLSIVKELVEAHGGTISASSEPGSGACFRIVLPPRPGGGP